MSSVTLFSEEPRGYKGKLKGRQAPSRRAPTEIPKTTILEQKETSDFPAQLLNLRRGGRETWEGNRADPRAYSQ